MLNKMSVETEKPTHERIIAVQNQLRIAIQNHHVLSLRMKNFPLDSELNSHLSVIQFLILSMGRAQAELLTRFRQEIATKYDVKPNNPVVASVMKKFLLFPEAPKHIPVYKPTKSDDSKRIGTWKSKVMKSVLRVNNNDPEKNKTITVGNTKITTTDVTTVDGSKIKIVYNKKRESPNSLLIQQRKKLQSVLKSKNIKINTSEKCEVSEEGRNSPESSSSSASTESKGKVINSRSNSPIEELESSEVPIKKVDTHYGRKYEAKMLGKTKIKILCDQNNVIKKENGDVILKDINGHEGKSPSPSNRPVWPGSREAITLEELEQEVFLGFFGLVSKEKCELLKRKRCERKRRSVAGQSSLYSDYFQPQPKRTYTPRKPPVQAANNAVIVEPPLLDDDDDEKQVKTEICSICHEEGTSKGALEICNSCSEVYHFKCVPASNKGNCPNCMAQTTDIPSIVGAETIGSASSSDLIKRYSNDEQIADIGNSEWKPPQSEV